VRTTRPLLFRWCLDLEADEFFRAVVAQARRFNLLWDEHFTVDVTLVEAWASLKSFKRKDAGPSDPPDDPGNPPVNFHGARRSNATHQSTTDPEARLAKQGAGKEAKLWYSANALMENRHALLVDFQVAPADGYAERRAALAMVDGTLPCSRRIFVAHCRALGVTPHVAENATRPVARPLTRARCGIRVTPSVSGSANRSKRPSVG
jgi:hypothetical protein